MYKYWNEVALYLVLIAERQSPQKILQPTQSRTSTHV